MTRTHRLLLLIGNLYRPVWWVCLWRGHDPGTGLEPGTRDHVGRPMECERCGRCDAEMAMWQYDRFCGVAARQEWDRLAASPQAAAMRRMLP